MAQQVRNRQDAVLHVRYRGRSFDIPLRELRVGEPMSDYHVRLALARYLDLPQRELEEYVVEHHEGGNWTVRPEAVFG